MYRQIYGRSGDADFLLVPMPRLEVETIQDFKVLYEIGALCPYCMVVWAVTIPLFVVAASVAMGLAAGRIFARR